MLGPAEMPGLPPECFKVVVVGQQAVSKGRQGSQALNKVQVRGGECGSFLIQQAVHAGVRSVEEGRCGRSGRLCGMPCKRGGKGQAECPARQRQQQQLLRQLLVLLPALSPQRHSRCVPLPQPAGHLVRDPATAARQRRAHHAEFPHLHQRAQRSGRARRCGLGGWVLGGCALGSVRDALFNEPCLLPPGQAPLVGTNLRSRAAGMTNALPCLSPRVTAAGSGFKGAHLTAPALFGSILASFTINDWSLFGGGSGGGKA